MEQTTGKEVMILNTEERGAQPMTKELYERMKQDPRFKKVEEEEIEKARKYMEELLTIVDDEGCQRQADLKNEEDVRKLAFTRNLFVLNKECVTEPKDIKTGFLRVRPETMPQDVNPHNFLPIYPAIMLEDFLAHRNSNDDILLWFPLINIPVFTPTLLMLLTGEALAPTSDSFSIFRIYQISIHFLTHVDFTISRRTSCLNWLCSRLQSGRLQRDDIVLFANNVAVADGQKEFFNPNDLIKKFDEKTLCLEDIDRLQSEYVSNINKYGAGWSKDKVFREDVIEEHTQDLQDLTEELYTRIESVMKCDDASQRQEGVLSVLFMMTVKFLHRYEISIMRLFWEASSKKSIPNGYWASLVTKTEQPLQTEVNAEVEECIIKNRQEITQLRDQEIRDIHSTDWRKAFDQPRSAMPTPSEVFSYLQFLAFNPQTHEETRKVVARLKKRIEVKNGIAIEAPPAPKTVPAIEEDPTPPPPLIPGEDERPSKGTTMEDR